MTMHDSVLALRDHLTGKTHSYSARATLGLVVIACAGFGGMLFLPLIVSLPVSAYGISEAAAGKYGAIELTAIACSSFLFAPRVTSLRPQRLIGAGLALVFAGSLASLLIDTLQGYFASRLINGIGEGAVLTAAHALVARAARPDRIFAIINFAVLALGAASYPWLSTAIAEHGAFALSGALMTLAAAAVVCVPLLERQTKVDDQSEAILRVIARWRNPLSATFAFYIAEGALWGYLFRLGLATGASDRWVGEVLSTAFVFSLLGPVFVHWLDVKAGRRIPLVVFTTLLCVASVIFALGPSMTVFKITTFVLYLVFIIAITYCSGLMAALDPTGRLVASVPGIRTVGMGLGPAMGGLLIPKYGLTFVGWLAAVGYSIAVIMFAASREKSSTPHIDAS